MLNKIQYKIALISALCLLIAVGAGITITVYNNNYIQGNIDELISDELKDKSQQQLQAIAELESEKIARNIEKALSIALAIKSTLETQIENKDAESLDRDKVTAYLKGVLVHNKDILGSYAAWEKNAVDNKDEEYVGKKSDHTFENGQFAPYWNRSPDGILAIRPLNIADALSSGGSTDASDDDWYLCPLKNKRICITEPYSWEVQGKQTLGTSITLPIIVDGKLYGMAGVDIGLDQIQGFATKASNNLYDGNGRVHIVSAGGKVAGDSQKPKLVGKPLESEYLPLFKNWTSSKKVSFEEYQSDYLAYAPIKVARLDNTWGTIIQVPVKEALAGALELNTLMKKSFKNSISEQIIYSSLIGIAGVIVLLLFARSISRPIVFSAEVITEIASQDGDLTSRLNMKRKDEIGKLANGVDAFISKTQGIVKDIAGEMRNVESSALKTSEIAKQSNVRVDKQREEIEMVAAAVTEMSANAGEVARNAEDAANSVSEVNKSVVIGSENVKESAESIKTLAKEMEQAGSVMQLLAGDSENIIKIVDVINSISEQTNLLALNAAIEAARAGDHGRGFSVVADEVRSLASKTKESTQEIQQLIDQLQQRSQQAVSALDTGNKYVGECLSKAEGAVDRLSGVVSDINGIDGMITQIATSSEHQAEVSEEISRSISNINSAINEVTDASNESLAESERLFGLVKTLEQQLSRFKY
jgi:methyl-accepting chemotaxis protein